MGREVSLVEPQFSPHRSGQHQHTLMCNLQALFGGDPAAAQGALLQLQMASLVQIVMMLKALKPELFQFLQQALTAATTQSGVPLADLFSQGVGNNNNSSSSKRSSNKGGNQTEAPASTTNAKYDASQNSGSVQDALFKAVIVQESGGKYGIVNKDSGALGIGQVMPFNVKSWSKEALGYSITPQQFLNSPDLQNKIIKFKLNQYYQEALKKGHSPSDAVRYVAAKWYSGKGENMNSTKPQNGYPSIRSYTMSVLSHYNKAKAA